MTTVRISTLHRKLCRVVSTTSMNQYSVWRLFRHMDRSSITVRWILSTTERFRHLQAFASDLLQTSSPLRLRSMIRFHSSADNLVGNVLTATLQASTSAHPDTRKCTLTLVLLVIAATSPPLLLPRWVRLLVCTTAATIITGTPPLAWAMLHNLTVRAGALHGPGTAARFP